jgi:hypothetical protein
MGTKRFGARQASYANSEQFKRISALSQDGRAATARRLRPPAANRCRPHVIYSQEESLMSSLSIPALATPAQPAVNFHSHGHGHKKGVQSDPLTDSTSGTTAGQIPAGAAQQNIFGSLLNSLEQVTGIQPPSFVGNSSTLTNGNSGAAATAAAGSVGSKINLIA